MSKSYEPIKAKLDLEQKEKESMKSKLLSKNNKISSEVNESELKKKDQKIIQLTKDLDEKKRDSKYKDKQIAEISKALEEKRKELKEKNDKKVLEERSSSEKQQPSELMKVLTKFRRDEVPEIYKPNINHEDEKGVMRVPKILLLSTSETPQIPLFGTMLTKTMIILTMLLPE